MPRNELNIDPKKVASVDAWYWVFHNKIQLQASVYSLQGHEYQVDILQSQARVRVYKKAAQMGFTEIEVLRSCHGLIHKYYPSGVMYLFPTGDDVSDFTKARFDPLIANNYASIGKYLQSTDAANIKKFNQAVLYLRGARSTSFVEGLKRDASKLRSVPVDKLVFDERDLMDDHMVTLALERMSHSNVKEEVYLSTPTIPEYGIDADYAKSDQRIWMIKCHRCNAETCLELDFPNNLGVRDNGTVFRKCKRCGSEIYPKDGRWMAQYPGRDIEGYWISQLNSVFIDPKTILDLYLNPPNGNIQEVYNSKLGVAYVAAENRLTPQDVYDCCSGETMDVKDKGPCAMGVDVGSELHVVIGKKLHGKPRIVWVGRVKEFEDLHDLAVRFNVSWCVIDLYPETRKVREFRKDKSYLVYGCEYRDKSKNDEQHDEKDMIIDVPRTEICDATHQIVFKHDLVLPARNEEIELYAKQMAAIVKTLEKNQRSGLWFYRYREIDADHYRHATNYFYIAFPNLAEADPKPRVVKSVAELHIDAVEQLRKDPMETFAHEAGKEDSAWGRIFSGQDELNRMIYKDVE